jgi:hypothetical protein
MRVEKIERVCMRVFSTLMPRSANENRSCMRVDAGESPGHYRAGIYLSTDTGGAHNWKQSIGLRFDRDFKLWKLEF